MVMGGNVDVLVVVLCCAVLCCAGGDVWGRG